jgi:hypothetical protein
LANDVVPVMFGAEILAEVVVLMFVAVWLSVHTALGLAPSAAVKLPDSEIFVLTANTSLLADGVEIVAVGVVDCVDELGWKLVLPGV